MSVIGLYREVGHGLIVSEEIIEKYGSAYIEYIYADGTKKSVPEDYEFTKPVEASCKKCGINTPHTEPRQHGKWSKKANCLVCGEETYADDFTIWNPTGFKIVETREDRYAD